MNKKQLFDKYNINESHAAWDYNIDNWMSVEIYKIMHNGKLPDPNDMSLSYITEFLDKAKNDIKWWTKNVMSRPDWGSLFLTAKRMVYRYSDELIKIQPK